MMQVSKLNLSHRRIIWEGFFFFALFFKKINKQNALYLYFEQLNQDLRRSGLGNPQFVKVPQVILIWSKSKVQPFKQPPFLYQNKNHLLAWLMMGGYTDHSSILGKKTGYTTLIFYFTCVATDYKSMISVLTDHSCQVLSVPSSLPESALLS